MVYLPESFDASNPDIMQAIIDRSPLAMMVTQGPDGLSADHIPLILEPNRGPHGTLIGHVARKNDLWREGYHEGETLIVFHAIDAYISPNWYPTKGETHKAVPTWNYAVVHAYGPMVVHEDEKWLRGVCGKLTRKMEAITSERPWKMSDAPRDYIDGMLADIVGIEIPITRIIGKTKASQNRLMIDREGAAAGLRAQGGPTSVAMAELIMDEASR
ncbi:MAG TPA: FMN-binding negative transcriptional regulator [Thermomicrobiales bacterium]|nr:FMN-binding negative transcriptional regulator [Thermomicrobiales bacterium]